MKKCIFIFLFACIAAGFAAAQDEGIGLSIGLEFGIGNINKANDEEMTPYLMPMLIYEKSFLDETLDIYTELDYTFGFTKEADVDGNEVNPQSIYFDFMIGYNLGLGDASALSFILENEFDELIISPEAKGNNALTGIFTPAIKFKQEFDSGSIFAKLGAPITYIQYDKDADTAVGLDFTFNWSSGFGLGLEAKFCTLVAPNDDAGYKSAEVIVSYEIESVYFQVKTIIPNEINDTGVTITPEFDYSFNNFSIYVYCDFLGIGADGGNVTISPALGIKFSF